MSVVARRPRFFYGWIIVAVSFVVFAAVNGVWGSFAIFYVALIDDLGWSRATTAGVFSVYMVVIGLTAPVVGKLADRFGPRKLMPVGAGILAIGLALASLLTAPWHLYLVYGIVIAFGHSCVGMIPNLRLIANWFQRRRGAAFGIASSGFGLGAIAFLPAIQLLVLWLGWRTTYVIMAGAVLLLAPLTGLLHRERPSDVGQLPDGDPILAPPAAESSGVGEERGPATDGYPVASPFAGFGIREAMATVNFWAMFASNVFFGVSALVLVLQVAHIVDVGYDPILAATVSGLAGLLMGVGRTMGGILSDRFGKANTGLIGVFLISVGVLAVVLAGVVPAPSLLFVYGVFFGLGWGFFGIIGTVITAYLFQGKSYGAVAGSLEVGVGIGGFCGPLLGGLLFDRLGSYVVPLTIAVATAWLGGLCFKLAFRGVRTAR